MPFFILLTIVLTLDLFSSATLKEWKKSIGFQMQNFMLNLLKKKFIKKKSNIQEARQTLKIIGYNLFQVFADFRTHSDNCMSLSCHVRVSE